MHLPMETVFLIFTMMIAICLTFKYSQLKKLNKTLVTRNLELEHLYQHDKLLNIYNRYFLDSYLDERIKEYHRTNQTFSVLLIDLDHFKHVNDNFGHLTGDKALRMVSDLIHCMKRDCDVLGRWGGEEFLIIAPNTNKKEAYILAERIRHSVQSKCAFASFTVTVSIGIAEISPSFTSENLLNKADENLYTAKRLGRNKTIAS